ncbi:MAG: T9SS type A sorting domain-containing protein [Bacteroidia bacterium]
MKKIYLFIVLCVSLLLTNLIYAQTVTTIASTTCNPHGLAVDNIGNVYFSETSSCYQINKLDTAGNIITFATLTNDPAQLVYRNGYIYVAYHWSAEKKIVRIPLSGGAPQDYVTNIGDTYGAWGMVFDGDTLFFVEYANQRIYKVLPGGGAVGGPNVIPIQNTIFGIAGSSKRTCGLNFLPNGNFIVSTLYDGGKIYEVNRQTGSVSLLLTAPDNIIIDVTKIGNLYYLTGYNTHKIYTLDPISLNVTTYAGTGSAGNTDGPLLISTFTQPYFISEDIYGNIYVTCSGSNKVRKIWDCHLINSSFTYNNACIGGNALVQVNSSGGNFSHSYSWTGPNSFTASGSTINFPLNSNTLGTYTVQITDLFGCTKTDSIQITDPTTYGSITATTCGQYTSPSGNYVWTSSGTYADTIANATGCDSVISVSLTITPNSTNTITVSSCNNYTSPSGNYVWTNSGTYVDTIPNSAGCDSIITIQLTINTITNLTTTVSGNTITANNTNASYQWLDCGNNYAVISGATSQVFTPAVSGSYAVQLTENGCVDTSACVSITILGIEESNKENTWSIYPNPNRGHFTIEAQAGMQFELMDYTGKIILSYQAWQDRIHIQEELSSGLYLIRNTESGSVQKLVIQN